ARGGHHNTPPPPLFPPPKRKLIIADTPGHTQHTRNMVTGSSTADLVLILVDARSGITEQTRRHAFLASLLGDNVVDKSTKMPWYGGPSLLDYLETVELAPNVRSEGFRFPVQLVVRP